jgi:hypothetical protein
MAEPNKSRNSQSRGTDPQRMPLAALPYDAWQGTHYDAPHSAPLERAPAPLADAPDHPRRQFELGSELGIGLPHCPSNDGVGCPSFTAGSEVALTLLVRPSPYFAFGVSGRRFAFGLGGSSGAEEAHGSALFFGLAGRAYFLESGLLDPYLELDLGGGRLDLDVSGPARANERVVFAPGARSAAGVDFALNSWLRLGTFVALTRFLPTSVAHCEALGCTTRSGGSSWLAVGATSLGVRLTFAAGEAL